MISKEESLHVLYVEIKTNKNRPGIYSLSLGYDHPIGKDYLLEDLMYLNRNKVSEFGRLLMEQSGKPWICTTVRGPENKDILFCSDFVLSFYVKDKVIVCLTPWDKQLLLPYSQDLVEKLKLWDKEWELK